MTRDAFSGFILLLISIGSAFGWSGANPNMVSDVKNLPDNLESVQILWEIRLGTHQYSSPTFDEGCIYIGINDLALAHPSVKRTKGGLLMCLDQATGRMIWQLPIPRFIEGNNPPMHFGQWMCGLCSSPVIDGKKIYVVGNRGEVLCVDKKGQTDGNDGPFINEKEYIGAGMDYTLTEADGDIVWIYNMIGKLDVVPHDVAGSTVLVEGDFIYVTTGNGMDHTHDKMANPEAPSLIVLDKRTGRLVAVDAENIAQRQFHGQWSSPALADVDDRKLILFGAGDGILYAFEPMTEVSSEVQKLTKVWSCDCNPDYLRYDTQGNNLRYSGFRNKYPKGPSPIIATPVTHEGQIYLAVGQSPICGPGEGALNCIDAATGKVLWVYKDIGRSLATVSVADGLVYAADLSGYVHCVDAKTGSGLWKHEMDAGAWAASTLVADGKVYVADEKNILWILKAGRQKQLLSRNRMDSNPITCVALDNILYVPTQRRLTAYKMAATDLSPDDTSERVYEVIGTVRYQQLEGGFFGIVTEDGRRFNPVNLPEQYRINGFKARFRLQDAKDQISIHMWGKLVEVLTVEPIE
ncbi:MAG: PQQ-binding-like beta-propeller repeat protein [Sedimentisphaerales bacterium]|nr:PQQ-binding-like beta-propeller repeat protein [Sedimentisphaerales bacterium]